MEEKKSIKLSLGTVICIIIIILLIVALFGMWYYYNNIANNNSINSENTYVNNISKEVVEENIKKINKIYEDKELVYPSYSKYSSEYSYSIPYINIKSSYVDKINQEIEDYYKPLIEAEIENEKQGTSIAMINVKYNTYLNNNILSLVISHYYYTDNTYYKTYNIDIYMGKEITNSEIVNQKKITENEFSDKLSTLYKEKFIAKYGSKDSYINNLRDSWMKEENLKEQSIFYEEELNRTISKENTSIITPMFLGENGKINVIAKISSLAGSEYYFYIIDTKI